MQREPFDPSEFEQLVRQVPWVTSVFAHLEVSSTNDEAARLARQGAGEGTVVVADAQTAGRGRLGRQWSAEPGTSLLTSWIVRPPIPLERRTLLSFAAAVAVASAIEEQTGVNVALKWPNDVLAGEGKLAGILAEALPDGAVVVGVGVNVRQDGFDETIEDTATSLLLERSRPIGRARLLGGILSSFAPFAHAPWVAMEEYRRRCATIGRSVRVERLGAEPLIGVALNVEDNGALIVESDGVEIRIAAGDVQHLRTVDR